MGKKYQPEILEMASKYMDILEDLDFFESFEIRNMFLVKDKLCDVLTEKFILGEDIKEFNFKENEWHKLLNEIIVGEVFFNLEKKGIIDSYEDERIDKKFFLTEKGKEIYKKLKKYK